MHHGRHIKVIGKGCPTRMRSVDGVRHFLEDLVQQLGMRCLGQPHTYEVAEEIARIGVEPFEDEGGTTGFVVLSTSHCAIHTWPLRETFVMDVYSCRDFEPAVVERLLVQHFEAHALKLTDLSHALLPAAESDGDGGDDRALGSASTNAGKPAESSRFVQERARP